MAFYHVCFVITAQISFYLGRLLYKFAKSFKQTQKALTQMQGFNRWVLQNIPAGLITFDSMGTNCSDKRYGF